MGCAARRHVGGAVVRIDLEVTDARVPVTWICRIYARSGELLGKGAGETEERARLEAALDFARNEALVDERIARELKPFRPRSAPKARFAQDAARLGKVRP